MVTHVASLSLFFELFDVTDVEGEETSKRVRLTGSFDKILEAHQAVRLTLLFGTLIKISLLKVMTVLDTYEAWLSTNQGFERRKGDEIALAGASNDAMSALRTASGWALSLCLVCLSIGRLSFCAEGDVLQMSTVLVMQPDGSCKATQVYVPSHAEATLIHTPPPPPPPPPKPTILHIPDPSSVVQDTLCRTQRPLFVDERIVSQQPSTRAWQRDAQTPAAAATHYTQLTPAMLQPVAADSGQVWVRPGAMDTTAAAAAAVNVFPASSMDVMNNTSPLILQPKATHYYH